MSIRDKIWFHHLGIARFYLNNLFKLLRASNYRPKHYQLPQFKSCSVLKCILCTIKIFDIFYRIIVSVYVYTESVPRCQVSQRWVPYQSLGRSSISLINWLTDWETEGSISLDVPLNLVPTFNALSPFFISKIKLTSVK